MAFMQRCEPCIRDECHACTGHKGPKGVIGGVTCPCRHTREDRRENARIEAQRQEQIRSMVSRLTTRR